MVDTAGALRSGSSFAVFAVGMADKKEVEPQRAQRTQSRSGKKPGALFCSRFDARTQEDQRDQKDEVDEPLLLGLGFDSVEVGLGSEEQGAA